MEPDQHGAEDHRADAGGEPDGERKHGEDDHVDLARVVSRIGRPVHAPPSFFRNYNDLDMETCLAWGPEPLKPHGQGGPRSPCYA